MPTLAELQRELAGHVWGGEAPGLAEHVTLPDGVDPWERLAVYQGGYPARVYDALEQCYPATHQILGEGSFAGLTDRYLPFALRGWCNLNSIGHELPALLAGDSLAAELPFLVDLARLEWAIYEAFHATLAAPAELASCEGWTVEQWAAARFEFRSDLALVASAWPIRDLWQVRNTPRDEIDVAIDDRPQTVWVARSGYDVEVEIVGDEEARAAGRLLEGACLRDAVEELASSGADEHAAAQLLSRWVELGWISAVQG